MKTVPSLFSAALAANGLADGVVLVSLTTTEGAVTRRALWPGGSGGRNVTYQSQTWYGTRGGFSLVGSNLSGRRAVWELSLTNVQGPDGTVLPWSKSDLKALRGADVVLMLVLLSQLNDADANLAEELWKVARPRIDGEWMRLEIGGPRDALGYEVPLHPIISQTCGWQRMGLYRKHPCGSVSAHETCNGSLSDCAKRFPAGSPLRYGPSYPYPSPAARRRRT